MTGPRSRRAVLRTATVALLGAAGCTGDDSDASPENEASISTGVKTTRTTRESAGDGTTGEATTTATEPPFAVEAVRIRSSFFYNCFPDAAAVAAREGTQFVFVELALVGSLEHLPSPGEIVLTADGREFAGTLAPGSADGPWELLKDEQPYRVEPIQSGWVAFEVPAPLDADAVALAYESNGRRFSEPLAVDVVERLARPPAEFEIARFEHPASVRERESFEISFAVENEGDVDGVFRAVLNQSHPAYGYRTIELPVPANDRREWSRTLNLGDAEEGRFTLLTPVGKHDATVEVVPETTTASG